MKLNIKFFFSCLFITAIFSQPVAAQYPVKPIKMILPFPAGSGVDGLVRILGPAMSLSLGQPIIVDYKPGGDGAIAASEVMRANPDGYTLLFATNSPMNSVPAMRKISPYDPINDFTPIGLVSRYLHYVLVNPQIPVKNITEFFNYAKDHPNTLNYGSGGTFHHISSVELMKLGGFNATHVYYKGEPQALMDLLAGRLQFMVCSQSSSMQFVRDGKLRALLSTSSKRSALDPNTPTMAEIGMPAFTTYPWSGIFGPAKLPKPIIERLNRALNDALNRPDVREQLIQRAMEPLGGSPLDLEVLNKEQLAVAHRVVRELNLSQTD